MNSVNKWKKKNALKKKTAVLIISIISIAGMTACQKSIGSQHHASNNENSGKTIITMELDENYDDSEPFVNASLFGVTDDIDVLEAEGIFQMDGEIGSVEIKDNETDEVLWDKAWNESVDQDTFRFSLNNMQKEKEYAVYFTGTKINHAVIKVVFESELVQERERPLKVQNSNTSTVSGEIEYYR
ncbi:DUF4624 family lipoprotein [Extibacter muris]|uniref:DUF4624 family lipoprotein n=1 Tax=Extibacter muris TaxID=1796622 RepID=UPI001D0995DE|nr:DUF4624 family lipoprotein [Extibacter muris]MCB6203109.1 DUF4624 domain-containing lipoprotein [Extibacter muris]MCQ4664334.1 DUF4624 domain-containing lipoprotein [Extibacter muris]MCQ4692328.1 DUF4624 domain-containing lipoprotein [Extibacter muris]MCQ4692427.1 DUF4624 domain-containing lipoprotein [Extibacter muris]